MLKALLLFMVVFNLHSLEISISSAKEAGEPYSILNIKNDERFLCQENLDDHENVVSVVCAFSKIPLEAIPKFSNIFFQVETKQKDNNFFIIIKPTQKIKLYPIAFDLRSENEIFNSKVEMSKSWSVVAYGKKIPFLDELKTNKDNTINFPLTFKDEPLPYVGSLDLKGDPIHSEKIADVSEYVRIKKSFDDENYENTLNLIVDTLSNYEDSLFLPELLYYKIKSQSKLNMYDDVIDDANLFLKKYASDENVAEVLSLLGRAYDKNEQNSDAEYFYDRLFSEHNDSIYAKWAKIYMAQSLFESAQYTKAINTLEALLLSTDNLEIGVEAGFELVKVLQASAKYKDAKEYATKILTLKPDIFRDKFIDSFEIVHSFADNEHYDIASKITISMLEDKNYPQYYEELLKNCAIWLGKSGDKKSSGEYLDRYISEFSDGAYIEDIKVAKDTLFFELDDVSSSDRLAEYDKLMEEYAGNTIAQKALYEKAKLLDKEGRFKEVLELENELHKLDEEIYPQVSETIKSAAIMAMQDALKTKECSRVLSISSTYAIELDDEWDDGVYECAMRGADYELAKKIVSKNITTTNIELKQKWLYRYVKVEFGVGEYSKVLELSSDLLALLEENSPYNGVYRYIFDANQRLKNSDKMIESILKVDEIFNSSYEDLARFAAVVNLASIKNDDSLVITYATKVMQIQKNSTTKPYSPSVEFALYDAYVNKKEYKNALEVIVSLDELELDKKDRSKQKYLLGNIYTKLWRDPEAKVAYDEAIKADEASPWAKLAKEANKL